MNKLARAVQAIVGSALLVGCATQGGVQPQVKPLLAMRDGGVVASGYYELGQYYQAKDRRSDAMAAYRRALALDDRLAEAHNALGALLASANDFDGATAEFNAAIALNPSAAHFRNNLGYALYLQGRAGEAIASFEIATTLDPADARAWNNMSLALAARGDAKASSEASAHANALAAGRTDERIALPVQVPNPPTMMAPVESLPDAGTAASPTPLAAAAPAIDAVPETIAARDLLQPIVASSVSMLRPFEAAELNADPALVMSLASSVLLPDPSGLLESIDAHPTMFLAMEQLHQDAWTPALRLESASGDRALQSFVADASTLEGAATEQPGFEPGEPIAWTMVASIDPATTSLLRIDAEPPEVPYLALTPHPGDPIAPSRDRAVGTLISEIPSDPKIVELAPNALELQWTGSTVMMRPVPAIEASKPQRSRLEVSNGNGVTGMAARIDGLFQEIGLPRARLTNQKPFVQRQTEVQYRVGHEAAAASLSARLPNHPPIARNDLLRADVDVRVVLGRDLPRAVALIDPASNDVRATGFAATNGRPSAR
jgi:Tfp pilus assembly protein PilF